MELEHRFELPVDLETAWTTLTDINRVGPCFPGATLDSADGDDFTGSLKIKLGPVHLTYKGRGRFVEKDPVAHRARIEATGDAARSASAAAMLVTATATALSPNRTAVELVTTLSVTGRPAKFGHPVMVEVGNASVSEFADQVSQRLVGRPAGGAKLLDVIDPDELAADAAAPQAATGPTPATWSAPQRVSATSAPPLDLLRAGGKPLLQRAAPLIVAAVTLVLARKLTRRKD